MEFCLQLVRQSQQLRSVVRELLLLRSLRSRRLGSVRCRLSSCWRPNETNEVGVTAKIIPSGTGSSVKVNIAATDLRLEQQAGLWMDGLDIFFIQCDDAGIRAGRGPDPRPAPQTPHAPLSHNPFVHPTQTIPINSLNNFPALMIRRKLSMKIKGCIALLLLASLPAWAADKKITVAELKSILQTMHDQKKNDTDVASALKQVQLSEQLTLPALNSLVEDLLAVNGASSVLSTEQIYVLEARSALLPPPAADIPANPAPDTAAVLAKAAAYASNTYAQLPALAADRTTLRFQDNFEALADSSGVHNGAKDAILGSGLSVNPHNYIRYINSTDTPITLNKGQETLPADKTQWGRNKMIEVMDPDPNLATVISEAQASGGIQFVRWETINGKPAAVLSYAVNKKKTHLGVHVCCFPDIQQAGRVSYPGDPFGIPGTEGGNFQTNTIWNLYKKDSVPYHGEIYIDPGSGIVVRLITQTEVKNSDMVHQDDERIDYGPVTVGDKSLVLPVRAVTITEVVPNGESGGGGISTRCTLFTSEYKNYQLAQK